MPNAENATEEATFWGFRFSRNAKEARQFEFYLWLMEYWTKLLEWLFIQGALNFVWIKTSHPVVGILYLLNLAILFSVVNSMVHSIQIIPKFLRSRRLQLACQLFISLLLSVPVYFAVNSIVMAIAVSQHP